MKHSRDWAEKAEISVADALNGENVSKHISQIAKAIQEKVTEPYWNAEWVGAESYDEKGDVHLNMANNTKVAIELKFSKKTGSGTKANVTTNIVKKFFSEDTQSYPEHEENIRQERYSLIEQKSNSKDLSKKNYEKLLRKYRKEDPEVLEEIAEITSFGQIDYAKYLAEVMNNSLDSTNKWVASILKGNHTVKDSNFEGELLYCVVKNFESSNQTVTFYNLQEVNSTVTNVEAVGKSIVLRNEAGNVVIRLSVHWKNICQGGATPCFNVFLGEIYA